MRYTRIDLEGDAGQLVSISRKRGSAHIDVDVVLPTGTTAYRVAADEDIDQWSMAQRLQSTLGADFGADRRDLFNAMQRLAD